MYGMPMTEEERMQQAIMRAMQQGGPANMEQAVQSQLQTLDPRNMPRSEVSQGGRSRADMIADATRSTAGQAAKLEQQQAYANALRQTKTPGLKTVGPSNIAVANPWEGLETAFNRALGGYMSGQLKDEYADIDTAEGARAGAEQELVDARAGEAREEARETLGLEQALRRELAAEELAADEAASERELEIAQLGLEADAGEAVVKGSTDLRKEFTGRQDVKDFQKIDSAFGRLQAADPTNAAGQMSLIFQYMKMMDPNSTVREGEYASAKNTTGVPGYVMNAYNQAKDGKFLSDTQVENFLREGANLYKSAVSDYDQTAESYINLSGKYGYDTDDVLTVTPRHRDFLDAMDDDSIVTRTEVTSGTSYDDTAKNRRRGPQGKQAGGQNFTDPEEEDEYQTWLRTQGN